MKIGVRVEAGDAVVVPVGDKAVEVAWGVDRALTRPAPDVALAVGKALVGPVVTRTGVLGCGSGTAMDCVSVVAAETGVLVS